MSSVRNWTNEAKRDLAESVAIFGNLNEPSEKFPLGRVRNWGAVMTDMKRKGYATTTMESLQAKWSREARGRLLKAKSSASIEDATDATMMLLTLSEMSYVTPPQSPTGHLNAGTPANTQAIGQNASTNSQSPATITYQMPNQAAAPAPTPSPVTAQQPGSGSAGTSRDAIKAELKKLTSRERALRLVALAEELKVLGEIMEEDSEDEEMSMA